MVTGKTVYLDRLSVSALVRILVPWGSAWALRKRGVLTIYHFDSSPWLRRWMVLLHRILPIDTQDLDYSLVDVRDAQGVSRFLQVSYLEGLEFSNEYARRELEQDPFIHRIGRRFDLQRLLIYLKKHLALAARPVLFRVNIVAWHHRTHEGETTSEPTFYIGQSTGSGFLRDYGKKQGVQVGFYWKFPSVSFHTTIHQFTLLARTTKGLLRGLGRWPRKQQPKELVREAGNSTPPVIASPFNGRGVTLDSSYNSDLFWLPADADARGQLLMYYQRARDPLNDEKVAMLEQANIRYVAMSSAAATSSKVPLWAPSLSFPVRCTGLILWVALESLPYFWRLPRRVGWLVTKLLGFVRDYAYWHDFFRTHNVKLHISPSDPPPSQIAAQQALAHLGGISTSYQLSQQILPGIHRATSADIQFAFGTGVANIERQSGANIEHLVATGYVHDHAFAGVQPRASRLRARLQEQGANFIVCFLDENSVGNKKVSILTHERGAENYRYVLNKLHEDPGLGLIFKPKKPDSLLRRLGPVAELLEAAIATGRCHLFEEGIVTSPTLPCEASSAADATIGLLIGSTAAMEARLAGTPSVLLDREHITYHPFYALGRGTVVFDDWDELWAALMAYREDPAAYPRFGNWSPTIDAIDPFRDGRAAERIGTYVGWLASSLEEGLSRQEAMEEARRRFLTLWGEDKVVDLRNGSSHIGHDDLVNEPVVET